MTETVPPLTLVEVLRYRAILAGLPLIVALAQKPKPVKT
jgi:hypothetical protein